MRWTDIIRVLVAFWHRLSSNHVVRRMKCWLSSYMALKQCMAFARGACVTPTFSGTVSLETERSCSFFVFGHWGMFAALAYGDVRLGLKNTERRDGRSSLQMLL